MGRLHGSRRARRKTVQPAQPVQLSLMPEQVPAPPATLIVELPAPRVAAAMAQLATLIAKAADPRRTAPTGGEGGDE
jgi:hypothetical protein